MKLNRNPIILIGMHRSGTSLISRCLSDLGVYMGQDLSPNAESRLFQQINRDILALDDIRWDDLIGLKKYCESTEFIEKGFELASRVLFNEKKLNKFFPKHSWPKSLFQRYPKLWGWKDPRNTWILPIYLHMFPDAKVVHVFRNGVDCAISLCRRESTPEKSVSERCKSFSYCFHLWEGYLSRCLKLSSELPQQKVIAISYEQLLREPENQLGELINFTNCHPTNEQYNKTIESINPERLDNSILREKYKQEIEHLPDSALMNKFGYLFE